MDAGHGAAVYKCSWGVTEISSVAVICAFIDLSATNWSQGTVKLDRQLGSQSWVIKPQTNYIIMS